MRIIQTVNDTIRLLYNPKSEIFNLSDFLLVRDCEENFLAQVIEVYDDKFDQEANVAKIKLIYRIKNGNEIAPYDNYTPSRECEVAKIKQREIEKCINLDKETIILGKSAKTKEPVRINTNFVDNDCVIFADKFEQTNRMFENLAPRLSDYKNVLVIDFSGTCKPESSTYFTACDNFKMPLSSKTTDYIQQKALLRAKLETQVILGDVFEEVKLFLESTEENYIPFTKFIKVIQAQCKKTQSVELLVLLNWLKKYAQAGIFAKHKREFELFFKSLTKNKITTLDMSNVKTEWQKEFIEYILSEIKDELFVFVRLNDNNINNDILNDIYLKKKHISFIPSFSYSFKKASYIMEFAKNYILTPTINSKKDFSHANFQIQSLNKESFMIYGEDTKDFIFTLENESPLKKSNKDNNDKDKDKLFVSLNLQLDDMMPVELRPNNFEVKRQIPAKKRLQEEIKLEDVLNVKDEEETITDKTPSYPAFKEENIEETEQKEQEEPKEEIKPEKEEAEAPVTEEKIEPEDIINEDELDYFLPFEDEANTEVTTEPKENIEVGNKSETLSLNLKESDIEEETETFEENKNVEDVIEEEVIEYAEIKQEESEAAGEEDSSEEELFFDDDILDMIDEETNQEELIEQNSDEPAEDNKEEFIEETNQETLESSTQNNENISPKEELTAEIIESANNETESENSENSSDEIDEQFFEILNQTEQEIKKSDSIEVEEGVSIDFDTMEIENKNSKPVLPVFEDEDDKKDSSPSVDYEEGMVVSSEKYGIGKILKVINYGTRCLIQIQFEESGKKLLDPKATVLKVVE